MVNTKTILCAFLLTVLGGVGLADAQVFGEWIVDTTPDKTTIYAASVNDSDHGFGQA